MKRSLQRHLSIMLGSAILLAGLVAAIASFALAYSEAKEFQDDMLKQVAALSAATKSGLAQRPRIEISDPESRILIFHLPGDSRPDWFSTDLSPGLHTLPAGAKHLRVYIRDTPPAERTVVAQFTDVRDEIAINSALRTLILLLCLLPVLVWLIVRIVRNELAPITRLSRSLDEQPADSPMPVSDDGLPDEITPFVHAINRLLERIKHLMKQQSRFIADAAHELRSPLTALSVQAQNLMHAGSLDAVHERAVPLQKGIARARHLTEQMLSLARTQAEANGKTEVNVSAMARELIAEYLPMAEAGNIDLGLDEIEPLSIPAFPDALHLIIKNALENALKYTQNGGEVTLRLFSDNHDAIIEIVDDGPGIPVSEYERVFDAFYRMPGTHGEGSGLGLAIVREAAIRMGGTVSLRGRQKGAGLVFCYRQSLSMTG
ncbi:MAG: hypothetical protein K2P57_04875 [Burkholderiales bacterium]|nr:hypothetical protein [Burkholderiales bacterium]